jgi:hypothetical protein
MHPSLFHGRYCTIWVLAAIVMGSAINAISSSYEVDGRIRQTIMERNGSRRELTNEFTVYVRDCGWLIEIIEADGHGNVARREFGSTNGTEMYELRTQLESADPPPRSNSATGRNLPASGRISLLRDVASITSGNMPVGPTDDSVIGHLWLMFASECYFGNLTEKRLRPVYDWQASAGMRPYERKEAKWELLAGQGTLPRDVKFLGQWGETNAHYQVTGTNLAGATVVPNGFVFEEFRISPEGATIDAQMVVRKRVVAEVTAVREGCSKTGLLPVPERPTMVFDQRLVRGGTAFQGNPSSRVFTYQNPFPGRWLSIDEAFGAYEGRNHLP